jgi:hypothetical protein
MTDSPPERMSSPFGDAEMGDPDEQRPGERDAYGTEVRPLGVRRGI